MTDIIMATFKLPNYFTFDEYLLAIETWIFQDDKIKSNFGFQLHDIDGDGVISPADVAELQTNLCSESSYMLTFDIMMLADHIKEKIDGEPADPEGHISGQILAQIQEKQHAREEDKAKEDSPQRRKV